MSLVVCRIKPSVNAAYVHLEELLDVSVKSVYNKINKVEPEVSRQLVCQTAARVKAVIDELGVFNDSPIPGYEVRIVDGNHHPASEHRLEALRDVAAAPLPVCHWSCSIQCVVSWLTVYRARMVISKSGH